MSIFGQIEQYGLMPVIANYAVTIDFATEILSAR